MEFAVAASQIQSPFHEAFLERFLFSLDHLNDDGSNDVWIDGSIPAEHIIRVVPRFDPDFARLTSCDEWNSSIT